MNSSASHKKKRIGFISTRISGTDGVSLEARKWATIFKKLGHPIYYCAGELDPGLRGMEVPEMHFAHPEVLWIHDHSFGRQQRGAELMPRIQAMRTTLVKEIGEFVERFGIDVLIAQNNLAIPMNIPFGLALADYIGQTGIPTIAHHHDFYWERDRFKVNCIPDLLNQAFPADLPSLQHVVINTPAQQALFKQRGLESTVIPNIFDFSHASPGISMFSRDLRGSLGLTANQLMILQPTRVIRRKGIELSIELVRRLRLPQNQRRLLGKEARLVITHRAGDEGTEYMEELQAKAAVVKVPLIYAATRFGSRAALVNHRKIYSLWDAYVQADFGTYPSRYEGFGNALLESIYFRMPLMVNRYNVYVADIAPLGFDLVEITGEITDQTVDGVVQAIIDPVRRHYMVEYNYQLALDHFSYEAITPQLRALLGDPWSS
jgi:glycosyltransferase involved in cell wall biosynthesis